jgi:hypothetical protein
VLTILAAAPADPPTPLWLQLVAIIGPVAGVIVGVVLAPLVEPWKLAAARRAKLQQDRVTQHARLIESANLAQLMWLTVIRIRILAFKDKSFDDRERVDRIVGQLQQQRNELHGATMLIRLYGPAEVRDKAQGVADADHEMAKLSSGAVDPKFFEEHYDEIVAAQETLQAAIDAFVVTVQIER